MSASSRVLSAEFVDFDAFEEAVEDADFTFRCTSLDIGRWLVNAVDLPGDIHVQVVSEGGGNLATGTNPPTGGNLFMHRDGVMLVNGIELAPSSPFFMPPKSDFMFLNEHSHRWFSIYLPEPLMHELGINEDAEGKEYQNVSALRSTAAHSDKMWRLTTRFLSAATTDPDICSTPAVISFRDELALALRDFYGRKLAPPSPRRGRPIVTDRLMVARAIDAIEASEDGRLTTDELVHVTGVSERSLRAAFSRYLGVPPKRFMQISMLNRARTRLSRARPEQTSVTRVAADLGEWDVGRFAMRYRQEFGESPSETLRNTP